MTPLLSIGLPVFNGAAHLRGSIESLLAQDVTDLELVISDNASTDETPAICADVAARDERVRYSRNADNIGAAANFDRAFELCSGRYFMWGSDDDLWHPRFASACIDELERRPEAVMCTSRLSFIDEEGHDLPPHGYRPVDTRGMGVERRVHELIARFEWYGLYSVIRPEVLRTTRLYRPVFGGDVQLLMELLLAGESLVVPEHLLTYRLPRTTKTAKEYAAEIRGSLQPAAASLEARRPYAYLASALLGIVGQHIPDEAVVRRIREDLAETLSGENSAWGAVILGEYAGADEIGEPPSALVRAAVDAALLGGTTGTHVGERPSGRQRERMRPGWLRRLAVLVLQPFIERQEQLDAQQTGALSALEEVVAALEKRVEEPERTADRSPRGV